VGNLYLILNLGTILIPFLASFHPRLKFYKKWKSLLLAVLITSLVFISWDVYFTKIGVWGFNTNYHLGYYIFELPIEEWLFFLCIPYACVFMHYALLEIWPKLSFGYNSGKWMTLLILSLFLICLTFNHDKWYPLVNYGLATVVLLFVYFINKILLYKYYKTFMVMLIPFFIINGVLTGGGIVDEVVWYNSLENMGIRIFTIPIEDVTYAFTLILSNLFIVDFFDRNN